MFKFAPGEISRTWQVLYPAGRILPFFLYGLSFNP
jgi:hypothetical protein